MSQECNCIFRRFPPHDLILWLAVMAGFVMSVMSLMEVCSSACDATSQYRIFGLDFGWFGVFYFTTLFAVATLHKKVSWMGWVAALMLFSAAGAEARFIWIQKYEIGQWCPICLGIASAVFAACLASIWGTFQIYTAKGVNMRSKLNYLIAVSVFFVLGLGVATLGVQKEADASELDLFLGKKKSATTVYFVSDWFCPACIKVEPAVEQMYPAIAKRARVSFVDFPIHRETTNFTPYNLQFLAFEKAKYIKLRHALSTVARKTKKPTDADVQAAVAHLGVRLRQMDNSQVLYGMQANLMVYRGYDVNATPSVVVTNSKTKKSKTLVGDRQITEQGVKEAIAEVETR